MKSKIFAFLLTLVIILAVSCVSKPKANGEQASSGRQETFDPRRVTQQQYDTTMTEVRQFMDELNRVIQRRNYEAWRAALSQEYFDEISSPENLRQTSELPAMKTRGVVLRNAQDYFIHVVVPSRANSRVDEIEFFDRNRVKAFTIMTNNRTGEDQRLRLYDLEKIGDSWKIIN